MLNLRIDDNYQISADQYNYMLQEIKTPKKSEDSDEVKKDYTVNVGYYNTITQALHGYKELQIRNSDATSVSELMDLINKLDRKIEIFLKGN